MPKIIVFGMQKGGVGKSTLAVNFAGWLAKKGMKTLLADVDPQASATAFFEDDIPNIQPENTLLKLFDFQNAWNILKDDKSLLYATRYEKLYLAPAIIHMSKIENGSFEEATRRLDYWLKATCQDFDYVIIDCPPSLGRLTSNALMAADYVVVPTLPEPQSYDALEIYIDIINQIKNIHDIHFIGAIVNNFTERRSVHSLYLENIKNDGTPVLGVIHTCIDFANLSHNKDLVMYQEELQGKRIYNEISDVSDSIVRALSADFL